MKPVLGNPSTDESGSGGEGRGGRGDEGLWGGGGGEGGGGYEVRGGECTQFVLGRP